MFKITKTGKTVVKITEGGERFYYGRIILRKKINGQEFILTKHKPYKNSGMYKLFINDINEKGLKKVDLTRNPWYSLKKQLLEEVK